MTSAQRDDTTKTFYDSKESTQLKRYEYEPISLMVMESSKYTIEATRVISTKAIIDGASAVVLQSSVSNDLDYISSPENESYTHTRTSFSRPFNLSLVQPGTNLIVSNESDVARGQHDTQTPHPVIYSTAVDDETTIDDKIGIDQSYNPESAITMGSITYDNGAVSISSDLRHSSKQKVLQSTLISDKAEAVEQHHTSEPTRQSPGALFLTKEAATSQLSQLSSYTSHPLMPTFISSTPVDSKNAFTATYSPEDTSNDLQSSGSKTVITYLHTGESKEAQAPTEQLEVELVSHTLSSEVSQHRTEGFISVGERVTIQPTNVQEPTDMEKYLRNASTALDEHDSTVWKQVSDVHRKMTTKSESSTDSTSVTESRDTVTEQILARTSDTKRQQLNDSVEPTNGDISSTKTKLPKTSARPTTRSSRVTSVKDDSILDTSNSHFTDHTITYKNLTTAMEHKVTKVSGSTKEGQKVTSWDAHTTKRKNESAEEATSIKNHYSTNQLTEQQRAVMTIFSNEESEENPSEVAITERATDLHSAKTTTTLKAHLNEPNANATATPITVGIIDSMVETRNTGTVARSFTESDKVVSDVSEEDSLSTDFQQQSSTTVRTLETSKSLEHGSSSDHLQPFGSIYGKTSDHFNTESSLRESPNHITEDVSDHITEVVSDAYPDPVPPMTIREWSNANSTSSMSGTTYEKYRNIYSIHAHTVLYAQETLTKLNGTITEAEIRTKSLSPGATNEAKIHTRASNTNDNLDEENETTSRPSDASSGIAGGPEQPAASRGQLAGAPLASEDRLERISLVSTTPPDSAPTRSTIHLAQASTGSTVRPAKVSLASIDRSVTAPLTSISRPDNASSGSTIHLAETPTVSAVRPAETSTASTGQLVEVSLTSVVRSRGVPLASTGPPDNAATRSTVRPTKTFPAPSSPLAGTSPTSISRPKWASLASTSRPAKASAGSTAGWAEAPVGLTSRASSGSTIHLAETPTVSAVRLGETPTASTGELVEESLTSVVRSTGVSLTSTSPPDDAATRSTIRPTKTFPTSADRLVEAPFTSTTRPDNVSSGSTIHPAETPTFSAVRPIETSTVSTGELVQVSLTSVVRSREVSLTSTSPPDNAATRSTIRPTETFLASSSPLAGTSPTSTSSPKWASSAPVSQPAEASAGSTAGWAEAPAGLTGRSAEASFSSTSGLRKASPSSVARLEETSRGSVGNTTEISSGPAGHLTETLDHETSIFTSELKTQSSKLPSTQKIDLSESTVHETVLPGWNKTVESTNNFETVSLKVSGSMENQRMPHQCLKVGQTLVIQQH
uniref:Uncharacterized protein n=2 Tax=Parascaris univalens TaxID=6257 RepID=A0A915BLB7_PARUN